MANPEHLDILKEGVEEWNQWREENLDVRPDLNGADLRGAKLYGADLRGAELQGANLIGADLQGAELQVADLTGADLTGADLRGAKLSWAFLESAKLTEAILIGANLTEAFLQGAFLERASLTEANLNGAYLSGADLSWANLTVAILDGAILTEANLTGANLSGAHLVNSRFGNTTIANTNLDKAKGLNTCIHGGPSTIDNNTLAKSRNLPLAFLEGVGLTSLVAGDRLTIEFTKARWGRLSLIEFALSQTLRERCGIEQHEDRIILKFESPDQFQDILNAVVPILAALEERYPGETGEFHFRALDGEEGRVMPGQTQTFLEGVRKGWAEPERSGFWRTTAIEAVRGVPFAGNLLAYWMETMFERKRPQQLYQGIRHLLNASSGADELPPGEPPKQLPPASDEST